MGLFKSIKRRETSSSVLSVSPPEVPQFVNADLVIAMPGAKFVPVSMNYNIKGKRRKNPLDPEPIQFTQKLSYSRHYTFSNDQETGRSSELTRNNPFRKVVTAQQDKSFSPFAIYSNTDELSKGMLAVFPIILESYGVSETDWIRFLEDVVIIGQKIPWTRQLAAGLNSQEGSEQFYKYWIKKYGRMQYPLVKELVSEWNERYFRKRGLLVIFQEPEDIWELRSQQEEGYEKPQRSHWDAMKIDQSKVITGDKTRIVVMQIEV